MADGEVSLDFLINDEASGSVDKIVDHAVKGANTIDTSATKSASKVREEAEKTRSELDKQFGKETRVKLTTQFDKAGVKNFDETLEKLPKEKQIELLTKANKGELIDVEKEIKALPPTVKSEIELKDNASPEIKKVAALSKKDIHQKLVADADTHGIKNFDTLLKKLPKKTQTQLMAKAESGEVINYEKTLRKLPSKVITNVQLNDNASPTLHKLQNDAEKTEHKFSNFKSTMAGTFVGNVFFKGAAIVTAGLGDIVQGLDESSKAWQTFEGNMHEFGKTDKEIKNVKGELQTFAQKSIYSASDMASTYSQLAAVGTKNTTELVKGFGGLSAAAEDPKQAMKTLSQQATQMAAKPKVAWEDFKLILEQSPAGMSAVAKQMGMSVGELTTKVQDGTVKTQDMFDAISKAGNSKSFSKMATNYKTVGEAVDGLEEGITNKLQPAFDSMSKVGITAISTLANKFDHFDLKPITTMFKNFGEIAKPIVGGMVQPFQDMGKAIGGVTKHTSGLQGFNKVLGDIGKHQGALKVIGTLLGSVLTGILAFKAITGVTKAINGVTTAFKLLKLAMISNPFGLLVVAVVALGTAFYELYKHNSKFKKFIDSIGNAIGVFFKSTGKLIDKGIKSIQKAFKGVMDFFKKDWKEILLFIVNPFSGAFALLYKHNEKFKKGVDGVVKWIKTTLNKFSKWFSSTLSSFGKWLSKTWKSIWEPIGDGFEAVFNFLGKIWNTWYKNFTHNLSGFGKWLSKTWHSIWNPIKKFYSDIWNDIEKIGGKAWDWISDHLSGFGKGITKTWHRLWNSVADFFGDTWSGIKKTGQRAWDWISDKLDDFGSNVSKGWHGLWNGLRDFFSDIWDDIKGLAKDGINGVIGFINKGIGGINTIIHDFGGKKTTIEPIGKFAHGTQGAPRGLAMVNDGFDSPTGQELIIDNQGRGTILEGRNQLVNFEGGETVVPAGVTHAMLNGKFANGTNDWFGGLKHFFGDAAEDISDMMKRATGKAAAFFNIVKNPVAYIKDKIFSPVTEGINNTKGSAVKALGNAFNNDDKGVKGNQNKWWKELWNMMKDTLSGGGKGGFGDDYLFKGHAKDDGADPWGYFFRECVSFVASRLKNEGVNPKLFTGLGNGSDWGSARVPHSSTPHVGDIAQYGAGSLYGNHVAVVTDVKGNKYREEGYNFGNPPNGKYYNSSQWHNASDASTFLRFPGAKGGKLSKREEKKQSPLQKMIRKQVSGMFDWVENMVSSLMPSFTGPAGQAPSGDHKHWLSQAGIKGDFDKWNYIISHESGWNPHAKNPGSDAYGIGQALPPSKMAAFGSDYMSNPITQLKWMQSYVNERYGGINGAYDFWRSHNWYANGGWGGNKLGIFNEVPGEEEIAINPHRNTSDQHIAEVIDKRSQLAPNSPTAKLQSYAHAIKEDMTSEPQVARMGQSQQINNKPINGQLISLDELKGTEVSITTNLNGQAIAQETVDLITLLHSKNLQIDAYGSGQGGLLNG